MQAVPTTVHGDMEIMEWHSRAIPGLPWLFEMVFVSEERWFIASFGMEDMPWTMDSWRVSERYGAAMVECWSGEKEGECI